MTDDLMLRSADLTVTIARKGAELTSIRDAAGREWLWRGDPASWPRQAPVLFPVVAQLASGAIRHKGRSYAMGTHGFGPHLDYTPTQTGPGRCVLTLAADATTRAQYPFDFRLDVAFDLTGATLRMRAEVTNTGGEPMPSCVGFHPGFVWPLPTTPAAARNAHVLQFTRPETAPIRRTTLEGVVPETEPNPVQDKPLPLEDGLFAKGALIFETLASRGLWFGVPGQAGLAADFGDMPMLGVWTRPPASYLCIEPWQGMADPAGFTGEIMDKPGVVVLAPGAAYSRWCSFTFGVPAGG